MVAPISMDEKRRLGIENTNEADAYPLSSDITNSASSSLVNSLLQRIDYVAFKFLKHVVPSAVAGVVDTASGGLQLALVNSVNAGGRYALCTGNKITTYTQGTANTGAGASATIVAANTSRKYLLICNDTAQTAYLGLGIAAENGKGVRLPQNSAYEISTPAGNLTTGVIYAYGAAAAALTYTEGV